MLTGWTHRVIHSNRMINLCGQMQTLLIQPNQIYKWQQQKESAECCNLPSGEYEEKIKKENPKQASTLLYTPLI